LNAIAPQVRCILSDGHSPVAEGKQLANDAWRPVNRLHPT
jgi:hypothetical protein